MSKKRIQFWVQDSGLPSKNFPGSGAHTTGKTYIKEGRDSLTKTAQEVFGASFEEVILKFNRVGPCTPRLMEFEVKLSEAPKVYFERQPLSLGVVHVYMTDRAGEFAPAFVPLKITYPEQKI